MLPFLFVDNNDVFIDASKDARKKFISSLALNPSVDPFVRGG